MKIINVSVGVVLSVISAAIGVPLINGAGCDYQFTSKWENISYEGICRFGHLRLIEKDVTTGEVWAVNARQFSLFNQVMFWVTDKRKTSNGKNESSKSLSEYNTVSDGFHLLNYGWKAVSDDNLIFFQTRPHYGIYLFKFEGQVDMADMLFDNKKFYSITNNQ